jgi:hypothetical protein
LRAPQGGDNVQFSRTATTARPARHRAIWPKIVDRRCVDRAERLVEKNDRLDPDDQRANSARCYLSPDRFRASAIRSDEVHCFDRRAHPNLLGRSAAPKTDARQSAASPRNAHIDRESAVNVDDLRR